MRHNKFKILSAMWTSDGRRFQEVGTYDKRGLNLHNAIFPNYKYGFNGRHFRVSTNYVSFYMEVKMSI